MSLREYQRKRDFQRTAEPEGDEPARTSGRRFVVQKHAARRLHYDFRLELDGVLKSWAVPKGPSVDPEVKALAVQVEDHPVGYATFEGVIPKGEYGGGAVMVWDQGDWDQGDREPEGDPAASLKKGRLKFTLHGERLTGGWSLVRMRGKDDSGDDGTNWLLIKRDDASAQSGDEHGITSKHSTSVLTGRTLQEIAADADNVWSSSSEKGKKGERRAGTSRRRESQAEAAAPDPSTLTKARKSKLPKTFSPQLATAVRDVPEGDQWLHELKFDGYRLLSFIDHDGVRLVTRRGNDWTDRFPFVAKSLRSLGPDQTLLDGELVALDRNGASDFQRLQNSMKSGREEQLVYYVFDAPFFSGYNLQNVPLYERKELLATFLLTRNPANDGPIRYSDHIRGQGPQVFRHSCRHALEGVISKRADSPYETRRSRSWVKSKCQGRQEFVIGGFTKPQGSRKAFGALLVGFREGRQWVYCGRVGTGFTQQTLNDLGKRLRRLERESAVFQNPPTGTQARGVTWTEPQLVAEVEFSEWTEDGVLRHPSFKGIREDKTPEDIVKENGPVETSTKAASSSRKWDGGNAKQNGTPPSGPVAGITLSHPDRVLYPEQGVTKRELAEYYDAIADWILPHIADRPLTIVRCPQGRAEKCFYQKHWTRSMPDSVGSVPIREKETEEPYIVIRDLRGLISLVQMSVLEVHPWGARADRPERPDRIVFDLDPGEGVQWKDVKQAAAEVRDVLAEAELTSFVRTSGGKGLHVVVPLTRRNSWEEVGDFAERIAKGLARQFPKRYVANMRKNLRSGRIFIDYLRNRRGATSIACYSTRARRGAPVAMPFVWDDLDDVASSDEWTVKRVLADLKRDDLPAWDDFDAIRQSITQRARNLAADLASSDKGARR